MVVFDSLSKEDALELAKRTLDETIKGRNSEVEESLKEEDSEHEVAAEEKINDTVSVDVNPGVVRAKLNSKLTVRNVKTNAQMLIVVGKSKFNTKPSLVGLGVGDKFKIRKDSWIIESID